MLRVKLADKWFSDLKRIQDRIKGRRTSHQEAIRIAHLDTGIDAGHEEMKTAISRGRIVMWRDSQSGLDPHQDRMGHGTHGASVIMRTAPDAVLYVARIVDDTGSIAECNYPNVERVSRTYNHFSLILNSGNKLGNRTEGSCHLPFMGTATDDS